MEAPNTQRIDRLLQFILAVASQEDFGSRELGPIHLIKYLYLIDLDYAENHDGTTYTGLPWKFHHFGPWSNEAYSRIEPALFAIGASKRVIDLNNQQYSGEFARWSITDDALYERLERQFPLDITTSVQKYVHKFTATTEDLLHFVYKTWPMLQAKPSEMLDFSVPDYMKAKKVEPSAVAEPEPRKLSARETKKKKQALKALKKEFKQKLENKKKKRRIRCDSPPYDDVYFEGLKTLDSLAGGEISTLEGTIKFSDDIWKSKARFDPDVP